MKKKDMTATGLRTTGLWRIFARDDKSKEQDSVEYQRLQEVEQGEITGYNGLVDVLRKHIVIFPGNLTEYERWRGYEVEIIDLDSINPDKRFLYDEWLKGRYMTPPYDKGCLERKIAEVRKETMRLQRIWQEDPEALINLGHEATQEPSFGQSLVESKLYGLLVRKKRI